MTGFFKGARENILRIFQAYLNVFYLILNSANRDFTLDRNILVYHNMIAPFQQMHAKHSIFLLFHTSTFRSIYLLFFIMKLLAPAPYKYRKKSSTTLRHV